jgi:hypothetical protein
LCFIIVFIIIVREGSTNRGDFDTSRIQQITSAVATGTFITVACCILFWPISAAKKLRTDLSATLGSYRVLLKLLTKTFLLDDDLPEFKANRTLQTAIEAHQGSFTALQKSLKEAKLETFWNNEVRGRSNEYDMIVKSMQRLAQHMGGLRSSCGIQFEMMGSEATQRYKEMARKKRLNASFKAASNALFFTSNVSRSIKVNSKTSNQNAFDRLSKSYIPPSNLDMPDQSWNVRPGYRRKKLQDEMRRQKTMFFKSDDDFGLLRNNSYTNRDVGSSSDHHHQTLNNQTEQTNSSNVTTDAGESGTALFDFIQTIRSPMKSLAYTCKQTLYHLQANFDPVTKKGAWYYYRNSSSRSIPSMEMLKKNLEKAISIFETAQKQAVAKLYRQRMKQTGDPSDISSIFSEDVFLVYFFVFNMTEFANELITLVNTVNKLNEAGQKPISLFTWLVQSIKKKLKGSDNGKLF